MIRIPTNLFGLILITKNGHISQHLFNMFLLLILQRISFKLGVCGGWVDNFGVLECAESTVELPSHHLAAHLLITSQTLHHGRLALHQQICFEISAYKAGWDQDRIWRTSSRYGSPLAEWLLQSCAYEYFKQALPDVSNSLPRTDFLGLLDTTSRELQRFMKHSLMGQDNSTCILSTFHFDFNAMHSQSKHSSQASLQ